MRPHMCFLQSQSVAWEQGDWLGSGDVKIKHLSVDDETGAHTSILELPTGYGHAVPVAFTSDTELFVLSGELSLNGITLGRHHYALVPAGLAVTDVKSGGAVLMVMPLGNPSVSTPNADAGALVHKDTFAMPWLTGAEGSVTGKPLPPTIFTKKLRLNDVTGEQTFLYCALPQHPPPKVMPGKFSHPMVEELFMLAGEYTFGDVGRMGPGAYVWWRENVGHGPVGSVSGYHMLIRVHGGELINHFSKEPSPFRFEAEYDPALPEDLKTGAAPFPFPDQW